MLARDETALVPFSRDMLLHCAVRHFVVSTVYHITVEHLQRIFKEFGGFVPTIFAAQVCKN